MNKNMIAGFLRIEDGVFRTITDDIDANASLTFLEPKEYSPEELSGRLNSSGFDRIYVSDRAESDDEKEKNLLAIRELCKTLDIPLSVGGHVQRFEDIKKFIYAGADQVVVSGSEKNALELCKEGASRFGSERIAVSLRDLDFVQNNAGEITPESYLIMNRSILRNRDIILNAPMVLDITSEGKLPSHAVGVFLKIDHVVGVMSCPLLDDDCDINAIKEDLGIETARFTSPDGWDELVKNESGLVPVVVQDVTTDQVLMVAYMNEEAFGATLKSGKMTYFSRSRQKLWLKGETSGHFQHLKSLTCDCDKDTLLAKVVQEGCACHTGSYSCFFNELVSEPVSKKNPRKVLDEVYETICDRKLHPKEGSYTNYLFDKGVDKILKKLGEEATEIVIAAKNTEPEEIKYEISDFLYHCMVLMVEKGVTWDDIAAELSSR